MTPSIWFDNKPIYGEITGILGVPPCAVINLSQIQNAGNCNVAWPLAIQGIAYDEYILETDTHTHPSDNFGGYCMTVTRQGGVESGCSALILSVALPVPVPTSPTTIGTNRVGDPGVRCGTASPPPPMPPAKQSNTLTTLDARMFDAVCAASAQPAPPAGFALQRANPATGAPGECCSFFLTLDVWDTTVCLSGPTGVTSRRSSSGRFTSATTCRRCRKLRHNAMSIWSQFVLAVLATWRVTHLLASEDGPGDVVVRFRCGWPRAGQAG